jgi:hypothetical protein
MQAVHNSNDVQINLNIISKEVEEEEENMREEEETEETIIAVEEETTEAATEAATDLPEESIQDQKRCQQALHLLRLLET